jgi:nitrate/nitrite transporter NarK
VVWAVFFHRWFRDRPSEHPSVNAAELALLDGADGNRPSHAPAPWRRMLGHRSVWLLWLQYFTMGYGWYFYITWLPTYLREARGMTLEKSAVLAGLPLFFGGIGCFAGGWLARWLGRVSSNVALGRRVVAFTGLAAAGGMLVWATRIGDPVMALVALAVASFANDLAMAPGWAACMDVGGRNVGVVSGGMNMVGNFGGAVGPLVVGYVLDFGRVTPDAAPSLESWTTAFLITAGIYGLGAIAWLFIDPVTPLKAGACGDDPANRPVAEVMKVEPA